MAAGAGVAAAVAAVVVLAGCHANDTNENVIRPVKASLLIDPEPVTDPVVFLRPLATDPPDDDLIVLEVVFRATAPPLTYTGFDLEIAFNPGKIQLASLAADADGIITSVGHCPSSGGTSGACDPICLLNTDCRANTSGTICANASGDLIIGVHANEPGCPPFDTGTGEVTLITIGFKAATVIESALDGRLSFVYNPAATGDSEIVDGTTILTIPFNDRNATILATR